MEHKAKKTLWMRSFPMVYEEVSPPGPAHQMRNEQPDYTLNLVLSLKEAYHKVVKTRNVAW
jgi:hypothetical protein